ncbi:DctP family TRAP transporter solute-binding subunit [Alkalihalobacillus oceani]|uniref:DctP family TRAP transporter solute-binding subunit n=1 Tax=Halalkalibacter oceani TaxID=1653776 RepID=UPI00203CA68E|nr:DctP family TRAP transporter solute-binding subunit [Halalkalibacter oceani]MCM3761973.1 DctP family TRAP transporter solute-binding subunit [Halalkalibacter oceani]
MKRTIILLITVLLVVSILAACGGSSSSGQGQEENNGGGEREVVTLKLATPDPDSSNVTLAAKEFANSVEERTDGLVKVEVHANGTLYGGDPSAGVKQLGAGSLDLLVLSTSLYANFQPEFSAISIPYLFDDREQFISFLNGELGEHLLMSVEDMGIKGLGYWTRDFRQITNSKRPITKPSDLEGIKLRVPNNPLWVEFFKGAGTVTTPMDFAEVYNALQLGTIDGQENPLGVIRSSNFQEVQQYLTISNHMADGWLVGVNQEKFEGLSEDHRQAIQEAVEEVQAWKSQQDQKGSEEIIEFLQSEGMEVNELSSEQQQQFVEVSQAAYPTFKELVANDEFFEEVLSFVGKSQ